MPPDEKKTDDLNVENNKIRETTKTESQDQPGRWARITSWFRSRNQAEPKTKKERIPIRERLGKWMPRPDRLIKKLIGKLPTPEQIKNFEPVRAASAVQLGILLLMLYRTFLLDWTISVDWWRGLLVVIVLILVELVFGKGNPYEAPILFVFAAAGMSFMNQSVTIRGYEIENLGMILAVTGNVLMIAWQWVQVSKKS